MDAEMVSDRDGLEAAVEEWDSLAVECRRPFCAPAWMLAWWDHVRPEGASLAVILVHDGPRLIGVAPLFADASRGLTRYRLLASGTSVRNALLATPGHEAVVAERVVSILSWALPRPHMVSLEGIDAGSDWAHQLARNWDGARVHRAWDMPAPFLVLEGQTYDQWFSARSSNFRQQMRRDRRRLEDKQAIFRMARSSDELHRDLASFASLHRSRWESRGGSATLSERVEGMLMDAGDRLLDQGRFRLWSIDVDGETISSHLFLAAGGEVSYWLGGFDERWAASRPALQTILAAIQHAWGEGDARVDLGAGGQSYKYRFADEEETVEWSSIVPRSERYLWARSTLVFHGLRRATSRRLPEGVRACLRTALRRRAGV